MSRLNASFGRSCDFRHPRQTEADSATTGISAGGGSGFPAGLRTVRAAGFLTLATVWTGVGRGFPTGLCTARAVGFLVLRFPCVFGEAGFEVEVACAAVVWAPKDAAAPSARRLTSAIRAPGADTHVDLRPL